MKQNRFFTVVKFTMRQYQQRFIPINKLLLFLRTTQIPLILLFFFIIRSFEHDWSQILFWNFTVLFCFSLLSFWMLSVMKPVLLDFPENYPFLNGLKILAALHLVLDNFLHSSVSLILCVILRAQLVRAFLFLLFFLFFLFHILIVLIILLLVQKPFIQLNRYHHVIDIIFTVNTFLIIHVNDEKQEQKLFEPFCELGVRTDFLFSDYHLIFIERICFWWWRKHFLVKSEFAILSHDILNDFVTFQICLDVIIEAFFSCFQSVLILWYCWFARENYFLF